MLDDFDLPANTDIMVTFATGSVAEMAYNWVKNVQHAGVREVLSWRGGGSGKTFEQSGFAKIAKHFRLALDAVLVRGVDGAAAPQSAAAS